MTEYSREAPPHGLAAETSRSGLGRGPLYDLGDYELLPDDGKRYEIITGDLYMTPAPTVTHQSITGNLYMLLSNWARSGRHGVVYLSPIDVELGRHDIVQPDLVYVSLARRQIVAKRRIVGAPDLVVEVLSPSTAERDRRVKLKAYDLAGVTEYWVVDPEARAISVHARDGQERLATVHTFGVEETLESEGLPGFAAPLSEIFAPDWE